MDTGQQLVQKMGSWGTNEAWDSGWYRKTHCVCTKGWRDCLVPENALWLADLEEITQLDKLAILSSLSIETAIHRRNCAISPVCPINRVLTGQT